MDNDGALIGVCPNACGAWPLCAIGETGGRLGDPSLPDAATHAGQWKAQKPHSGTGLTSGHNHNLALNLNPRFPGGEITIRITITIMIGNLDIRDWSSVPSVRRMAGLRQRWGPADGSGIRPYQTRPHTPGSEIPRARPRPITTTTFGATLPICARHR